MHLAIADWANIVLPMLGLAAGLATLLRIRKKASHDLERARADAAKEEALWFQKLRSERKFRRLPDPS